VQDVLDAGRTEGAFIAANAGIQGRWRQIAVTKLAIGVQFEHKGFFRRDPFQPLVRDRLELSSAINSLYRHCEHNQKRAGLATGPYIVRS
jgi:hypothetical protein